MRTLVATYTAERSKFLEGSVRLQRHLTNLVGEYELHQEMDTVNGTASFTVQSSYDSFEFKHLLWQDGFDVEVVETPTKENCHDDRQTMAT